MNVIVFCDHYRRKCIQYGTCAKLHMLHMLYISTITRSCVLLDFLVTVNAAPHDCVIRTGQP